MTCPLVQIASIRDKADKIAGNAELLPEELTLLNTTHSRKLADFQKKSMAAILRDISAHRVISPS